MGKRENPFVAIGASLGGIFIAIVAIVMIFGNNEAWILPIIAAAIAVMGMVLGFFAYKAETKKKK